MKTIAMFLFVVSVALAACGNKKPAATNPAPETATEPTPETGTEPAAEPGAEPSTGSEAPAQPAEM